MLCSLAQRLGKFGITYAPTVVKLCRPASRNGITFPVRGGISAMTTRAIEYFCAGRAIEGSTIEKFSGRAQRRPMPTANSSIGWHIDCAEMLLIRAGHHLWRELHLPQHRPSEIAFPGKPNLRERVLWEAVQTIWQAKREYRAPKQAGVKARAKAGGARLEAWRKSRAERARK